MNLSNNSYNIGSDFSADMWVINLNSLLNRCLYCNFSIYIDCFKLKSRTNIKKWIFYYPINIVLYIVKYINVAYIAISNALQRNTITNVKKTCKLSPALLRYWVITRNIARLYGKQVCAWIEQQSFLLKSKNIKKKKKKKKNWKYVIDNKFFCKLSLNHRD